MCTRRMMIINGYIFSLILYLSMLHFGYAQTTCVGQGNECNIEFYDPPKDDCCGGLVCDYTSRLCMTCLGTNNPNQRQRDCSLKYSNCCPGYYCSSDGDCKICQRGEDCGGPADCRNPRARDSPHGPSPRSIGANCPMSCAMGYGCKYSEECSELLGSCSVENPGCCPGLVCAFHGNGYNCIYCTPQNGPCSASNECCKNYRCDDNHVCQFCGISATCTDNSDCMGPYCLGGTCWENTCQGDCVSDADCCGTLTCYKKVCQLCTPPSNQCGDNYPDCCADLTCFGGECQDCVGQDETCRPETSECCGTMTCFASPGTSDSLCQPCTVKDQDCSWDIPDCCAVLSCYQYKCQRCVLETASCENEEDAVPCCGTFTCYDGTCQDCVDNGGTCDETSECCGTLTCYKSMCQDCVDNGGTCDQTSECCVT